MKDRDICNRSWITEQASGLHKLATGVHRCDSYSNVHMICDCDIMPSRQGCRKADLVSTVQVGHHNLHLIRSDNINTLTVPHHITHTLYQARLCLISRLVCEQSIHINVTVMIRKDECFTQYHCVGPVCITVKQSSVEIYAVYFFWIKIPIRPLLR